MNEDRKEKARQRTRKWRENNLEREKENCKKYARANRKGLNEYLVEWRKKNKDRANTIQKRYRENNNEKVKEKRKRYEQRRRELRSFGIEKEKDRVRNRFLRRVQRGKIMRPTSCEKCKKECVPDGHHYDYSKPFDVLWLCRECHGKEHRKK